LSSDIIKKTCDKTTQYARISKGTLLKRTFKLTNAAFDVAKQNEVVACARVYSDTPIINYGSVVTVIFVGIDSQVTDIYGINADK
jgi:hypothetical protein